MNQRASEDHATNIRVVPKGKSDFRALLDFSESNDGMRLTVVSATTILLFALYFYPALTFALGLLALGFSVYLTYTLASDECTDGQVRNYLRVASAVIPLCFLCIWGASWVYSSSWTRFESWGNVTDNLSIETEPTYAPSRDSSRSYDFDYSSSSVYSSSESSDLMKSLGSDTGSTFADNYENASDDAKRELDAKLKARIGVTGDDLRHLTRQLERIGNR